MTNAREVIRLVSVDGLLLGYENADRIIAALKAAGLVIVPKACTEKMAEAYDNVDLIRQGTLCYGVMAQGEEVWRAMVEAADDK
jgi:hypothetical protein